jgi:serine/threonine-protein kinase
VAAEIGVHVARGLQYAHRITDKGSHLGLVHRDVTPHNVLLSYEGAVKLTDFGIARVGSRLTTVGSLKGKFAYMSPEQARAEPVDARTDVFALGIVLWELVTGGRLFDGDNDVAILKAVQHSAIAEPSRINPDVEPALNAAIMKALERDLATRFQAAHELERALATYLLGAVKTVEDRDVGSLVRRAFAEEGVAPDALLDRTESRKSPLPAEAPEPPLVSTPSGGETSALSPDEDGNAGTFLLQAAGAPKAPQPPRRKRPWAATTGVVTVGVFAAALGVTLRSRVPVAQAAPPVTAGGQPTQSPIAPKEVDTSPAPLAPHESIAPVGSAAPAPSSPQSEPQTEPSGEPVPSGFGRVVLRAKPWRTVVLDGESIEVDGKHVARLKAGEHDLRIPATGHAVSLRVESGDSLLFDVNRERLSR